MFGLEAGVLAKLFKGDELVWALAEMISDLVKEKPRLLVGLSCDVLDVFWVDAGPGVVCFHGVFFNVREAKMGGGKLGFSEGEPKVGVFLIR